MSNKYVKLRQLGSKGKEGIVFLVTDSIGKELYAMKTFKKTKSSNTLSKEIGYLQRASDYGVAPKLIDYDLDEKWIVMELLDRTLLDILKHNNGILPEQYQKQIIDLYRQLDRAGLVHNDANPLNIMEKNGRLYLIDFGFSKDSTHPDFSKHEQCNYKIMPIGLILWLKELGPKRCDEKSWSYIKKHINERTYKKIFKDPI